MYMKSKKTNNGYVIRLDKGEEIISTLTKFCEENNICGSLQGIGGVSLTELGYLDVNSGKYINKTFDGKGEIFELLNLQGNVTILNNKSFVHIHLILGREDYSTFGGHLIKAIINPTCEIFLTTTDKLERKKDGVTGLNLIDI